MESEFTTYIDEMLQNVRHQVAVLESKGVNDMTRGNAQGCMVQIKLFAGRMTGPQHDEFCRLREKIDRLVNGERRKRPAHPGNKK